MAKRYGDDGRSNDIGLRRLLLLGAVIVAGTAVPPQTNR